MNVRCKISLFFDNIVKTAKRSLKASIQKKKQYQKNILVSHQSLKQITCLGSGQTILISLQVFRFQPCLHQFYIMHQTISDIRLHQLVRSHITGFLIHLCVRLRIYATRNKQEDLRLCLLVEGVIRSFLPILLNTYTHKKKVPYTLFFLQKYHFFCISTTLDAIS